jgi:hypothetical protein
MLSKGIFLSVFMMESDDGVCSNDGSHHAATPYDAVSSSICRLKLNYEKQ